MSADRAVRMLAAATVDLPCSAEEARVLGRLAGDTEHTVTVVAALFDRVRQAGRRQGLADLAEALRSALATEPNPIARLILTDVALTVESARDGIR